MRLTRILPDEQCAEQTTKRNPRPLPLGFSTQFDPSPTRAPSPLSPRQLRLKVQAGEWHYILWVGMRVLCPTVCVGTKHVIGDYLVR